MQTYDVVIIGAGTAGLSAYRQVRDVTDSVLLIEDGPLGTTCARTGCMPSKLFIAAANRAEEVRTAETFGIRTDGFAVDGAAVMERVRRLRDSFVEPLIEDFESFPDEQTCVGKARFREPGILEVNGEPLRARRVVIAVGSTAQVPGKISDGVGDRLLTIDDIWKLKDLPRRLVVFGAGVIGAETALAMSKLGVDVRCLSKGGTIAGLSDPEVTRTAHEILGSHFPLDTEAEIDDIHWEGEELVVRFREDDSWTTGRFDAALAATGRRPDLDCLELEAAGLELDEDGMPAFDAETLLCEGPSSHPVFVAGDAAGGEMVLPEAHRQGDLAGKGAAHWPERQKGEAGPTLLITFTSPSMATIGSSYTALKDRSDLVIGCAEFADQGRARCEDRDRGIVRIYGSKEDGAFLGAELIAPGGEHLAHLLAWAASAGMTVSEMAEAPVYHPVLEEGLQTALKDCADRIACA